MTSVAETIDQRRSIRPFPLVLADRLRYPKLTVSLGVAASVSAGFLAASSPLQITGMAITFAGILTYLAGFVIFASERTLDFVAELRPLFASPLADELVSELNRVDPIRYAAATLAGVVLGCFNVSWTVALGIGSRPDWPIDLAMVLGSMCVWIFSAQVIYLRAHNGALLTRLGREALDVDLYRPQALEAFARIGILDVLIVAGVLALTPFQSLDAEFRYFNYFFAFLVGVPTGLFLLVAPMWGIQQHLRAAKTRALREVDAQIAAADRGAEDGAVARMNALVARRQYLEGVHHWPIGFRSVSRVAVYFIIPPLAWIGAALVEMLVEAALHEF